MNKEEFIQLIKSEVSDSAVKSIQENLIAPPGRKPSPELLAQSKWYKSLSIEHKAIMHQIISEAVNEAVFGFLCVIDGVRSISSQGDTNGLELYHVNKTKKLLLNTEEAEYLHDIYNRL